MQKQDIDTKLKRKEDENLPQEGKMLRKANADTLKERKIVNIKAFSKKESSGAEPSKAVFNFSSKVLGKNAKPVSGEFVLKPNSASLDFFGAKVQKSEKKNIAPVSGEIDLKNTSNPISFFRGNVQSTQKKEGFSQNQNQEGVKFEKKKEEPQEESKKEAEKPASLLFGKKVEKEGIGSGLFKGLVQSKENSKKQDGVDQEKTSGLFSKSNNSFGSGLFSEMKASSTLFGNQTNNSSGLFSTKSEAKQQVGQGGPLKKGPPLGAKTDPEKFNHPDAKPMFGEPVIGGLFDSLKKANPNGLFSGLAASNNTKGGLFSGKLFSGSKQADPSSFFKKSHIEEQEEEDEEEEKEESVDESKVEMKFEYKEEYDKIISLGVRDFKEQAMGAPPPEGGFGNGSISLETQKQNIEGKDGKNDVKTTEEKPQIITFVYRNQAKLVKHQSIIIKGLSSYKILKSRKLVLSKNPQHDMNFISI